MLRALWKGTVGANSLLTVQIWISNAGTSERKTVLGNTNCFQTLKDIAEKATENHMRQNHFDKPLQNLFSFSFCIPYSPHQITKRSSKINWNCAGSSKKLCGRRHIWKYMLWLNRHSPLGNYPLERERERNS